MTRNKYFIAFFLALTVLSFHGCAHFKKGPTAIPLAHEEASVRLATDLKTLASLSDRLNDLTLETKALNRQGDWRKKGYFTSSEHDRFESLIFHFLNVHDSLHDMVRAYDPRRFTDPRDEAKGFLISFNAALLLDHSTLFFVSQFSGDKLAINKLNEAFYRLDVPAGSYHRLFLDATSVKTLQAVRIAQRLYEEERKKTDSDLNSVIQTDPNYEKLAEAIDRLIDETIEGQETFLKKDPSLGLKLKNKLRHSEIVHLSHEAKEEYGHGLYVTQGVMFKDVSRLKRPGAHPLVFSEAQKKEIYNLLEVGDVLLTFTSGYMSNIFLPGVFKHGLTYIGTPEEREEAGLSAELIESFGEVPEQKRQHVIEGIQQRTVTSGAPGDLIEAIAEGVIMSNLTHILNTHVNRLVILRPKLDFAERRRGLLTLFFFFGAPYDFKFDFSDAAYLCCTELVYRSLNTKGGIEFRLTERARRETLSADDIVRYCLSRPELFDFILFAEEDSESKGYAKILTGVEGKERVEALMEQVQPKTKGISKGG